VVPVHPLPVFGFRVGRQTVAEKCVAQRRDDIAVKFVGCVIL